MRLLILIFAVLLHQNLQLVQSFQKGDATFIELKTHIEIITTLTELQRYTEAVLDSLKHIKKDLTTGMRDLSLWFVHEGLKGLNELIKNSSSDGLREARDNLSNKIKKCIVETDVIINATELKFSEIKKTVNVVLDTITEFKKVSPESDELVDQIRQEYQLKVTSHLTNFLTELKRDSESVPFNVKKCVESVSVEFSKLGSTNDNEYLWSRFTDQNNEIINKMYEECSSYILEGLGKAQEVPNINVQMEKLSKTTVKIVECGVEADKIINAAHTKSHQILEEARRIMADYLKDNDMESGTLNDDYQRDYLKEDLKELFDSEIAPTLNEFVRELKENSISTPLNVKKCVDEAVNVLRISSLKIEL